MNRPIRSPSLNPWICKNAAQQGQCRNIRRRNCKTCEARARRLISRRSVLLCAPRIGVCCGPVSIAGETLEHALRIRERQQAAIAALGQRALAVRDLRVLLPEAVRLVADTLEVEYVKILERLPSGDASLLRAGVGWRPGAVGVLTMTDEAETRFLEVHGVVSGLSVVIAGPRHAWGVLGVPPRRRRHFNGDDVHSLAAVANVVAAAVEADAAQRRLAFLAEASTVLSASLEYEAPIQTLGRLAVPELADWCFVDVVDEGGRARRVAVAHLDPTREPLGWDTVHGGALDPDAPDGVSAVIHSGRPDLRPVYLDRRLGLCSLMLVPLTARDRTFGVIAFAAAESRRRFAPDDLASAEELARRAALAADNARLFQEASGANRAKDEFLTVLSHELRTPLTSILGWARMLRSGKVAADAVERALETIERNAVAQTALVDDLLDISRIASGTFALDVHALDLVGIVEVSLESARPAVEAAGLPLRTVLPNAPLMGSGDAGRLQQVAGNLLSNAIKFTPAGGNITGSLEADTERARLTVADNGPGLSADFLPHVFDSFRQADSSLTRVHGGLGIGLAIVRHLVDLHGGRVSAASAGRGAGSSFIVELPLVQASTSERPAVETSPATLRGVRVLIVEDDRDTRELLETALTGFGAATRGVVSVHDALHAVATWQPHVVVADIALPGEDGYALIDRLRRLPVRTPAIALTGYVRSEDRQRALAAGYQVHIAKPVEPAELGRVVALLAGGA